MAFWVFQDSLLKFSALVKVAFNLKTSITVSFKHLTDKFPGAFISWYTTVLIFKLYVVADIWLGSDYKEAALW